MKHTVTLFSALGRRLNGLGNDARSRDAIRNACAANAWFTPEEIRRSAAAITRHMLQPEALTAWLARYPVPVATPRRVLVITAGNIPLVGFFDLLCVLAAGHRCLIKPATKDRALTEYIVGQLLELDPSCPVAMYDGEEAVEAVIATGGDNAVRHVRTRYAGIPALLRGHRQSVAVLSGKETPEQLAALGDDIRAYAGMGCRSVSMIWLPRGYKPQLNMPPAHPKYRNNYLRERALLEMTQTPYTDLGESVAVEQREFPTALSRIAFARYDTLEEVTAWLAAHDEELQCVVAECLPHSRRVGFGCTQSPGLDDWPDACDVLQWLTTL